MKTRTEVIARIDIVDAIARFRLDMEELVDGACLVYEYASIGHVLYDMAANIGMTPEEKVQTLGLDIIDQIENIPLDIEILDGPHEIGELIDWSEIPDDQNLAIGKN